MLFNEPKLLKSEVWNTLTKRTQRFSALQRAEIAEIERNLDAVPYRKCFSALQRAEIAEILSARTLTPASCSFSALQRAEIAEIPPDRA